MSKLKVTTIANISDTENPNVTNVINGSAKAWVNFNGTGTVAIRASFNVSSITDNGTGLYAVNMTNAIADTNYCVTLSKQNPAGTNVYDIGIHNSVSGSVSLVAPTTTSFAVMLNASLADSAYVMCAVFR